MPPDFLTESEARDAICRVGHSLFARGYMHATAGNISVRLADGYLITPTDACLGTLEPTQLARLDAHGLQQSGPRASKTFVLHQRIYAATAAHASASHPAARCIIHTHSTHTVACSLQAPAADGTTLAPELLPALTPYFVMKVGHVPHLPYHRPGAPEAADAAAEAIARYAQAGQPIRAVMLARLGPNVWHASPQAAMAVLEELEETAKLWLLTRGAPAPLPESALQALRQHFGAAW